MNKNIDWVVVGLGNPEQKYIGNRHNIGWMVANELAVHCKKDTFTRARNYFHTIIQVEGQSILIALPTTFMNNSGKAVKKIINYYQIPPEKLIVILDEYNFPVGKIHLRKNGGDGGHNGIISIIEETGTSQFLRLRCGIAKNFEQGEMADYVLSDFKPYEIEARNQMIKNSVEALLYFFKVGPSRGMSDVNSGKIFSS
ncbi:MAG TPA: aminoacyl-tRNA hydrolase [Candidatus Kapabacteria bacterium]|nr:aminoacyl-tRNA hydrolase [Candidatus Kapabacteria bacterium]HPO62783.1 aminoacyl-tRNA hydrolase [Candidatus Kapabacteria bacterium]